MWAASIARGAPSAAARLTACRLPKASVSSVSTTPSSSASMMARTASSRPGTPAASESLLRSSMRGSLLREPGGHASRQVPGALLLHGVPAPGQEHELGARHLGGEALGLVDRHHAVLGAGDDERRDAEHAQPALEAGGRVGLRQAPQRDVPALHGELLAEGVDALLVDPRRVVPAGAQDPQARLLGELTEEHGAEALDLGR